MLDRQVQWLRRVDVPGPLGVGEGFEATKGPFWAGRRDLSDGERWRAGEVQAHVTVRFTLRWSPEAALITPADRLVCEGEVFEIVGRKEIERRRWIELTCAIRNDRRE